MTAAKAQNKSARRQPDAGTTTLDKSMLRPEGFKVNGFTPSAVWCYVDPEGLPIYATARFEAGTLGQRKEFRQYRWDAGKYLPRLKGGTLPLYCQHELDAPGPVLFVEGEKNADALRELGYTTTTTPGGTGNLVAWLKARGSDLERFRGRPVFVLPDADKPGREHGQKLAEALHVAGADVRLVSPDAWAHLGDTADPFDYIQAGNGRAELDALLDSAMPFHPEPPAEPDDVASAAPDLDPAALHGLAGDFVVACRPYTEAHDAGLLFSFLTLAGCCAGADIEAPVYFVGAEKHHARLFVTLCGPTAKGRKGTAWAPVKMLLGLLNDLDDALGDTPATDYAALGKNADTEAVLRRPGSPIMHDGGLSSGEGLGFRIRDEREIGKEKKTGEPIIDEGEPDKRMVVYQSEFGGVLRMKARDGNTLSDQLRAFFDGNTTPSPLTKNDRFKVTRGHPCLVCNVTIEELHELLDSCSHFNGFSNRFLWVYVERARFLPRPPRLPDDVLRPIAHRLRQAVLSARGRIFRFTGAAGAMWDELYYTLEDRGLEGRTAKVTDRASAYTVRLAMLYAILDGADAIDVPHLKAAAAAWAYAEASAVKIFGPPDTFDGSTDARKVRDFIRRHGGRCGWSFMLQRITPAHLRNAQRLTAVCDELVSSGAAEWVEGPPRELELTR